MARSPLDIVRINALGTPENTTLFDFNFSDFTSFVITNSITGPAEARFELGDDSGYPRLQELCGLGAQFVVMVNDRPRITGRVEATSSPCDADKGTVQSFVVRTRMSDAVISSAPQGIRLKNASIKDFVLACYEGIGLTESDFDFQVDVSRDLMTGKDSRGQRPARSLEPLKEESAKVNPPESTYSAVDRHLRRHGMLHWDGPDGRIIVGSPDDQQEPLGALCCYRPPYTQANNLLSIERVQDVSQAPTILGVFGISAGKDFSKTRLWAQLQNDDLIRRGFRRAVVINDEALRTIPLTESRARRELATRNRGLDRIIVTVDGLSYNEGVELFPWAPDTVFDVTASHLGGSIGNYYVEDVELRRSADAGDVSQIVLVKQGVWVL